MSYLYGRQGREKSTFLPRISVLARSMLASPATSRRIWETSQNGKISHTKISNYGKLRFVNILLASQRSYDSAPEYKPRLDIPQYQPQIVSDAPAVLEAGKLELMHMMPPGGRVCEQMSGWRMGRNFHDACCAGQDTQRQRPTDAFIISATPRLSIGCFPTILQLF